MLAYLIIVSTATAAFLGAPLWTFLLGSAALALISAFEHRHLIAAVSSHWRASSIAWGAWQSAGHATIAGAAAYLLGALTRLWF